MSYLGSGARTIFLAELVSGMALTLRQRIGTSFSKASSSFLTSGCSGMAFRWQRTQVDRE